MTRRGLAALPLAAAMIPQGAAAQAPAAYRWRDVKVGGGGFIPGIVFSPAEKGLAYLRSDMGGAYRWDAGAGRWLPLQDGEPVSSYYGVESIAPDPRDPEVVYAAVGMHRRGGAAILRSTDRGATWKTIPVPFAMGGNEDGRGLGERLAIDPADTRVLYFASRHDGLQRSADRGETWKKVAGFPLPGRGAPAEGQTNGGLSFVVFGKEAIFVGVADAGPHHLYRSGDGGGTWKPVAGGPDPRFSAAKAAVDGRGVLYVTYTLGIGPNGVTDGAVWRLAGEDFRDITPPRPSGGFMGVAVDPVRPGTVLVSTLNCWRPGDTLWRTTDDGKTWTSLRETARHDVSATPFLYWGNPKPDFGWWMAALAIDPFDADHAVYATGATVYATGNLSDADHGRPTDWTPWTEGIEQTAVITLVSLPDGPSLLTGFGDISGFAHEDLTVSPKLQFTTPVFANTNQIDYAGMKPNIVVRSGTPHEGVGSEGHDGATLAWSEDFGRHWTSLGRPRPAGPALSPDDRRMDLYRDAPILVSADGATFVLCTPQVMYSDDRGRGWKPSQGLPAGARPVADRRDPLLFYALDFQTGSWRVSIDGARTFSPVPSRGLPPGLAADRPTWREKAFPLKATPGREGDLWYVSAEGLYHTVDGGQAFERVDGGLEIELMDFGKAPSGAGYPALFAIGRRGETRGVFRSDDRGRSWRQVNDDAHQWGRRFRAIAGDPRVFGRVYVATDGRGVVYGEPAA
ncbi:MAG: hypothetical protein EON95_00030 [Caulobacteraceae bacterium]|nr:MAG: hypothetical protein EON95_00030 [Caulobacteraceae bacterium]